MTRPDTQPDRKPAAMPDNQARPRIDPDRRPARTRDAVAAPVRQAASDARRPVDADGLLAHRQRFGQRIPDGRVAPERPRASRAVRSEATRADLHRSADHAAVSVQRVLRYRRRPRCRRLRLQAEDQRPRHRSARLDLARVVRAAACRADHAAYLRGRVERDRPLGRHAVRRFSAAHRRGHEREVRRLQMRGRLLRKHRHADRAASANAADVSNTTASVCPRNTASR